VRKECGFNQRLTARHTGLSRDQLKRVESGETAVRFGPAFLFCHFTNTSPLWLAFGEPERRFGFFGVASEGLAQDIREHRDATFLEIMQRNREDFHAVSFSRSYGSRVDHLEAQIVPSSDENRSNLIVEMQKKVDAEVIKQYLINLPVKQHLTWSSLRNRLRVATRERGAQAEIARLLEVTPQAVAEWLAGASAPTADNTLRLFDWITKREAQQKQSAGSGRTRPARKTRKSKSKRYEKAKSSRRKQ
jgi:transcriptional regulator with XRE-family HTH domain